MKWGNKNKQDDFRIIKRYAWFPIRIKDKWVNKIEWRWLEVVKIEQTFNTSNNSDAVMYGIRDLQIYFFGGYWKNTRFVDFDLDEKRDEKLKKIGI